VAGGLTVDLRPLGRTGVQVSTFCLGTMMFGAWGDTTYDDCEGMVHDALDAGINVFDTADVYDDGQSERWLGQALDGHRDDVVLATKFHNPMGEDPNRRGNSRRWITQAVDDSLRRLRTDWIDLYQVHRPDPSTDIDETLGALTDLVHAGKVRSIGTSTFPAPDLVDAQWTAQRRHRERPVSEQPPYSIFARGIERDVLPVCERYGLAVLVWAPLNGGWLTGKYRRGGAPPARSRAARVPEHFDYGGRLHERKLDGVDALTVLADEAGLRLVDLAHAFVLAHPAVTSAILGPRSRAQLADVLKGAGTLLEADVLDRIDAIVAPGETLNPYDAGYDPPSITDPSRRRR
jgi:aryl-alcohol dehydrogenase-like predicted oxidoreductase